MEFGSLKAVALAQESGAGSCACPVLASLAAAARGEHCPGSSLASSSLFVSPYAKLYPL